MVLVGQAALVTQGARLRAPTAEPERLVELARRRRDLADAEHHLHDVGHGPRVRQRRLHQTPPDARAAELRPDEHPVDARLVRDLARGEPDDAYRADERRSERPEDAGDGVAE